MNKSESMTDRRKRAWLIKGAAFTGASWLGGLSSALALSEEQSVADFTPECVEGITTISQTSGPFYTPNSPHQNSLRIQGVEGVALNLSGRVLNQFCKPIEGAVLDFWHADSEGVYDNRGYRLRGHLFSNDIGEYSLASILPGLYPGRTRHIHVIVQGRKTRPLTTQLYFSDEQLNLDDVGYDSRLELLALPGRASYQFDFVLQERQ